MATPTDLNDLASVYKFLMGDYASPEILGEAIPYYEANGGINKLLSEQLKSNKWSPQTTEQESWLRSLPYDVKRSILDTDHVDAWEPGMKAAKTLGLINYANGAEPVKLTSGDYWVPDFNKKTFTGSSGRDSYVYQDWIDPEWATSHLSPLEYNGKAGYRVSPEDFYSDKFGTKVTGNFRGAKKDRGMLGLGKAGDLAALAAAIYFGGPALMESLGAGGAATAGEAGLMSGSELLGLLPAEATTVPELFGSGVLGGTAAATSAAAPSIFSLSQGIGPMETGLTLDAAGMGAMGDGALGTGLTTGGASMSGIGGGAVGTGLVAGGVSAAEEGLLSQLPSWVRSLAERIPGFLGSSAGQALVGQVLGNIGNKSIRDDMEQMLRTIRDQNPFTGMGLEDIAKQSLTSPVGQDQLNQLISKMGQEMPFQGQAKTGFDRAASLVSDPTQNAGYNLATTGSRTLSDLYTNPLANPIMEAVSRLTGENAARRSAAGRGMNAGSMPAEMQDALMAALGGQFANLASGYGSGINAGSNFYNTEVGAAKDLGSAASTANLQYGNNLSGLANAISQAQNSQTNRANIAGDLATKHMNTLTNIMPAYFNNYLATNARSNGVQAIANESANNNLANVARNLKAGKDIFNEVKSWNLF